MNVSWLRATAWALACGLVMACQGRIEQSSGGGEAAADAAWEDEYGEAAEEFDSEAERTQAMEELADEAQQQFEDAMADAATDEERIRAYEEFEEQRLELNEMAESESTSDDGDAYGPPPAP